MTGPFALFGAVVAATFGAVIGSFLNVVILRMPEGQSIVVPGSHCPRCQAALRWYHNLPILSWLALGGKCHHCKTPISLQYPVVEALNALLYLAVVREFGFSPAAVIYCLLCSALLTLTVIDVQRYLLPDEITLPGIAVGFAIATVHSLIGIPGLRVQGLLDAFLGLLLGGGVLLGIAYLGSYYLAWRLKHIGRGAEPLPEHVLEEGEDADDLELMAMGGGDIKLLAMLGTFLGWRGAYLTLLLASLVGAVAGIVLLVVSRKGLGHRLPFGPYIAIGAVLTLVASRPILAAYHALLVAVAHAFGAPV